MEWLYLEQASWDQECDCKACLAETTEAAFQGHETVRRRTGGGMSQLETQLAGKHHELLEVQGLLGPPLRHYPPGAGAVVQGRPTL